MGAFSYAYDIGLIAPSIESLNEMLKLCHNYATVYNDIHKFFIRTYQKTPIVQY